jgi:polyhydroxybutyrate depolymerase
MKASAWTTPRALAFALALAQALGGCSRAGLDAITGPSGGDGGGNGGSGAGCTNSGVSAGDTMETVQVGSSTRSYLLHVPSSYSGGVRVPLILDFHGLVVNGTKQRMLSTYPAQTDDEGVIMAFPNGASGPAGAAWNVGTCCVSGVDDVAFARAVVAQVQASACIDPTRVYAVGFAMGGGMAYQLGCHAADLFAGIAPSAFDLAQENVGGCLPTRPLTVISFRGTADTLIPYGGGSSSLVSGMPLTFLGAQATFQKWAQLDGCTGEPSAADANGCQTYSSCDGGVLVTLCTKQGGGTDQGNAAIGWPVLQQHPL